MSGKERIHGADLIVSEESEVIADHMERRLSTLRICNDEE